METDEYDKLYNVIKNALELDNIVLVDMPRQSGKTETVLYIQNKYKHDVCVPTHRINRNGRYCHNTSVGLSGTGTDIVVIDEAFGISETDIYLKSKLANIIIFGTGLDDILPSHIHITYNGIPNVYTDDLAGRISRLERIIDRTYTRE